MRKEILKLKEIRQKLKNISKEDVNKINESIEAYLNINTSKVVEENNKNNRHYIENLMISNSMIQSTKKVDKNISYKHKLNEINVSKVKTNNAA